MIVGNADALRIGGEGIGAVLSQQKSVEFHARLIFYVWRIAGKNGTSTNDESGGSIRFYEFIQQKRLSLKSREKALFVHIGSLKNCLCERDSIDGNQVELLRHIIVPRCAKRNAVVHQLIAAVQIAGFLIAVQEVRI